MAAINKILIPLVMGAASLGIAGCGKPSSPDMALNSAESGTIEGLLLTENPSIRVVRARGGTNQSGNAELLFLISNESNMSYGNVVAKVLVKDGFDHEHRFLPGLYWIDEQGRISGDYVSGQRYDPGQILLGILEFPNGIERYFTPNEVLDGIGILTDMGVPYFRVVGKR